MKDIYNNRYVTICNICGNPIGLFKPEYVYNIWRKDHKTGEMSKANNYDVCERCYPIIEAIGLLYKQAEERDKRENNTEGNAE